MPRRTRLATAAAVLATSLAGALQPASAQPIPPALEDDDRRFLDHAVCILIDAKLLC